LTAEERRREPLSVEYRVEWSEEEMLRARAIPAHHIWTKKAPPLDVERILGAGSDAAVLLDDMRHILADAPIRRMLRGTLVQDDRDTEMFRALVGLLLTTRGYHNWLMRHGAAEAAPLLAAIAKARATLRRARLRLRQASHAGSKASTWHRALADSLLARSSLRGKVEALNSLRTSLPEPPLRHVIGLRHAAAIGVVHQLYHDYGLPDATIATLLGAVGLPALSPRTIKRLRIDYRRP
jgi:hypothetical protein